MRARVLIVEDEFFLACEIVDLLEAAGAEVLGPCPTVAKALAQVDKTGCDAAVLDVSLRNESSLPVARVLAERGIPFVIVTGFSQSQLPPEMATAPLLSKPLHGEDLVATLKRLLPAA
jgi:DNA-binding response OmpR family regulator